MTNKTHTGILIVVLAAGLAGCGGASSPSAPSTAQPQQTGPDTYYVADVTNVTLSGVVYEMTPTGRVPIEGVRVTDYFHVYPAPNGVTDSHGFFSFRPVWVCPCSWAPWVDAGITSIWVDKDGYQLPAGQPASIFDKAVVKDSRLRDVKINGDTRLDIELVRRR